MVDTNIESILGHRRAKQLDSLDDSEKKEIIKKVLDYIYKIDRETEHNCWSPWSLLDIGHSNASIAEFTKIVDRFEFEELKLVMDLNGIDSPEDWLEFARFLVKIQHGKQEMCGKLLERLAKVIIYKASGFYKDKEFLRTFYKVPVRQLLRFFSRYQVVSVVDNDIKEGYRK